MTKLLWSILILLQWQSYNCILPADPPRSKFKTVDLSNHNLTTEDFFIKLQHSIMIHEVEELILRGNLFESFIDCSTKIDNLRTLDLSYNRLTKFFFLCQEEYNLITLNISHNQIEYINEQALTHRVMKLKTLDVSYNDLWVVNDTMLEHMKSLEHLSLASNPIGDNIDEFVFQNITKLKHLNLRNISSYFFSPMLFEPLVNLEYLDLSENPIEDVPPLPSSIKVLYISNTWISHLGTFIMPQLRLLNLDYSVNLTSVLLNNFENLTQLEILSMKNSPRLSEIRLKHMNPAALLPKLKRFSLQSCGLQTLSPVFQPIIQKTAIVDLQNNPWNCDCHMKWLSSMNLTTDLINSFRCQSPALLREKLLHDIPSDDLICEKSKDVGRIFYTLLWICLVLVLFGLCVSGVVYYSRSCLSHWAMKIRHRGGNSVSYANVVNENDLVRILPGGETTEHMEI